MKKVFTVSETIRDNNTLQFEWQKTHGNYLAVYGSSSRVSIYDRHGNFVNNILLDGKCQGIDWEHQGDVLAAIDSHSSGFHLWDVHMDKISKIESGFKDTLTILIWSKNNSILGVGTSKGNLLLYNHMTSNKIPILGKHSRKITCGAWSEEGLLVLGSEDKTITISNDEGETVKQTSVRDFPSNIQFSEMKDDERSSIKENTVSFILGRESLFLFKLTNMENSTELTFQEKYGTIVDYKWFGDGYIMIGFSNGYFIVISTHKKEIGNELHQSQDYKDSLRSIGISNALSRAVTVGDRCVKFHELNNLKEVTAIIELDEDGEAQHSRWSEDGQLLGVSSATGNLHVFLTKLPMLACVSCDGTKLAYLTSLREISVEMIVPQHNKMPNSTKILPIDVEPKFIGVGPRHLAVGMNNQAWYYQETEDSYQLLMEQEYMKTVTKLQLNHYYSAAYYDGKIMIQKLEVPGETEANEKRIRKQFPEQSHASEYISAFELTANFLIFSTDKGSLNLFFMEDWSYACEYKHHCGILKLFVNDIGSIVIFIDSKSDAYLFNPLNESITIAKDIPAGTIKILWDYRNEENSLMLVATEDILYTFTFNHFFIDAKLNSTSSTSMSSVTQNSSINTIKLELIGFTKIPFGHKTLYFNNGDVLMLNQNGKIIKNTLGTHSFKQDLKKIQTFDSNALKTMFTHALNVQYFPEAWKIAEYINEESFWNQLGESALKVLDIELAIRVYRKIGDVGMVFSLLKIRDIEDRYLLGGFVAMYLNDFNLAQDLFLNSSTPTSALDMRRDLLQWETALQLAKILAPSQIPFISREYAGQLEFIGDYINAMMNYERGLTENDGIDQASGASTTGGVMEHIEACTTGIARMSIRLGDARRGIQMAEKSNNKILMKECAMILEQTKQLNEAGALYERAGYFDKAINVYIKLKNWKKVGELLNHTTSPKLHLLYAKALEAEQRYKEAAVAYEIAKDYDKVIKINLEYLNDIDEAVRIVQSTGNRSGAYSIAQYYIKHGAFSKAIEFLVMSKCLNDAFRLARDHGQMEIYAKIIGPDANIDDYLNIANYFEYQKNHHNAGKFFLLACQYEKAVKHLLKVPYEENSPSVDLAIRAVGLAHDDKLTHFLVGYLVGEIDNIPKNMKYLFQMYMVLKQYSEAARTAVLIARDEQTNGNYRIAHDLLFSMMRELRQNNIRIPSEMSSNLMLLHSYIIAKIHIKRGDHLKGARMLIRVAESISKFPSHVVPILTSTVIECHRSNLRDKSFSYAAMLMRPEYRDEIDPKYRKKMENIVRRKPTAAGDVANNSTNQSQQEEPSTPCPFCPGGAVLVPETQVYCNQCKNNIPYCIATGRHIIKDDLVSCPVCEFPAIGYELRSLLSEPDSVCPMCNEVVNNDQLRPIIDVNQYLHDEALSNE